MAELQKHSILLLLIALLVAFKFVVVPIFSWQATQLVALQGLEQKQNKISQLLKQQNSNSQVNTALTAAISLAKPLFFPEQPETDFKLTQQKVLEALLAKHDVKSQNIGWQTSTRLADLDLVRYPIKLSVIGKGSNIIEFITAIESKGQYIKVHDFNLSFKGQGSKKLGRVTGAITLHLFVAGQSDRQVDQKNIQNNTNTAAEPV
jgi:Tfp pilus assembly protein PilO